MLRVRGMVRDVRVQTQPGGLTNYNVDRRGEGRCGWRGSEKEGSAEL